MSDNSTIPTPNLLKIKVMEDCPNREKVLDYYTSLSNRSNGYKGDSGIDLLFPRDVEIGTDGVTKIKLGIQCEMVKLNTKTLSVDRDNSGKIMVTRCCKGPDEPKGYMLVPRSSISSTPLSMANSIGIIDAGYRGQLIVPVRCHLSIDHVETVTYGKCYMIKEGQKLFQIVAFNGKPIRVEVVDELSKTHRDDNGFGSTNTNS